MQSECSEEIPGFGPIDRKGHFNEKLLQTDPDLEQWFEKNKAELQNPTDVDHKLKVEPLFNKEELDQQNREKQTTGRQPQTPVAESENNMKELNVMKVNF